MSYPNQPPAGGYQEPTFGPPQPAVDPGRTMGIVGLILGILGCTSLIGLIVSIVARSKSKAAGFSNGIATAGIIVSALVMVGGIITGIVMGIGGAALLAKCAELGPGVHTVDGVTVTCGR